MSLPTMENFDLTATFINTSRFAAEGHKFSTFYNFPGSQPAALAKLLISDFGWKFFTSPSASAQVYHNPSYTSCLKRGSFWFDSPVADEVGCYTSTEFRERYETQPADETTKYLTDFDLKYYRKHGLCVRYKKDAYEKAKNRPAPSLPRGNHEPVKFRESNPDLFPDKKGDETTPAGSTPAAPESAQVINNGGGV